MKGWDCVVLVVVVVVMASFKQSLKGSTIVCMYVLAGCCSGVNARLASLVLVTQPWSFLEFIILFYKCCKTPRSALGIFFAGVSINCSAVCF